MSNNQFRDCKKFRYGDVVEYVAVQSHYEHLNGSVGLIVGGPMCRINPNNKHEYAYPIAWAVKCNCTHGELRGEFCNEDRLRKVMPQR